MNATRTSQDAARLAIAIGRINRRIRSSEDGMTHGQLSVLSTIVRWGPLRPGDIARREHLAPPSVTRLVADLESRELVRREADPLDRRSFFVLGTPQGEQAIMRARAERARNGSECSWPLWTTTSMPPSSPLSTRWSTSPSRAEDESLKTAFTSRTPGVL